MTVQAVQIIKDRIESAENGHQLAVFRLPPFIRGDGESLIHNEFKYTRDHLLDFFDAFFDGMIVTSEIVKRGHNRGGQLLGVYGAQDSEQFLMDIQRYQVSL